MQQGYIVEMGPAQAVLESPEHPYARLLKESVLPVDDPGTRARAGPGSEPGPGCRGELRQRYAGAARRPQRAHARGVIAQTKRAVGRMCFADVRWLVTTELPINSPRLSNGYRVGYHGGGLRDWVPGFTHEPQVCLDGFSHVALGLRDGLACSKCILASQERMRSSFVPRSR